MEKKMEDEMESGDYRVSRGNIRVDIGDYYRDNGKENGNYYSILGII